MVKRNVGERARILFDDIDLKILRLLNHNSEHMPSLFSSVMELADTLSLKHKNLKPHIDKLLRLKLVSIFKDLDGKTLVISEINNKKPKERDFKTKEEYIEALKEAEKKSGLLSYLEQSNEFSCNKKTANREDFDIRKMKRKTIVGSKITTKQAMKLIKQVFD